MLISYVQSFLLIALTIIVLYKIFTIEDIVESYTQCAEYRLCEKPQ